MAVATFTAGSTLQAADDATTTAVGSATLTGQPTLTLMAVTAAAAPAEAIPVGVEEVAGLAAGNHELYIEQGATLYRTFTCSMDDAPWSWDGWTARAQIRTAATESATLLLDLTPYLTVSGAAITLYAPATATETLHQNGRWDLEMVQGDIVVRLLEGPVTVSKEVTRAD